MIIIAITIAMMTLVVGATDLISAIEKNKTNPVLVSLSRANSSVFDLIAKDGNVTKIRETHIIQGVDDMSSLPNTTYEWMMEEPKPLVSIF